MHYPARMRIKDCYPRIREVVQAVRLPSTAEAGYPIFPCCGLSHFPLVPKHQSLAMLSKTEEKNTGIPRAAKSGENIAAFRRILYDIVVSIGSSFPCFQACVYFDTHAPFSHFALGIPCASHSARPP